ncbi:hypothetical protein WSK_0941 [Novosphingobium sp. Rr 2-17]|uniref:hypothetical protein n=1 Tax=Novosphingobium sp. Rr 2-17 TaxID=555793 RepID=UPI00026991AF|nr:hypothetical protein [Novosphingobium sp. Rr 2-17]EIZ80383.1 hypothetical protein WSK_0941 [Novosphingobium sp. Rr 2-17]
MIAVGRLRALGSTASLAVVAALGLPQVAGAQTVGYDNVGSDTSSDPTVTANADADTNKPARSSKRGGKGNGRGNGAKHIDVVPYIELDQIVTADITPGSDVLTYTQAVVGVDATIAGRNNALSASVRYAHQIGWGKKANDGDQISGIARGYTRIAPGLTVEAGALATRTNSYGGTSSGIGSSSLGGGSFGGNQTVYSVYAGPALTQRVGDLNISASYRLGYTKVTQDGDRSVGSFDTFDESIVQVADLEAGFSPGTLLPVGVGVAASGYQENISNLDQRVRDFQARALVTVPVSRTVQVVGAVGYEDVEVSSRDAKRNADGTPMVGSDGRYVTDKSSPRQISYDVSGLIWDVAVMWRPSPRTSLSAHIGRRYGSISYGGNLSYAPSDRSQLSISVYDNISGYGGQVNRLLGELSDDFEAVRDPVTGQLQGCVATLDGNNCLSGVLGSLRSSTFRARGVTASYSIQIGRRLSAGIGVGYDRRNYIAAQGTVLASANGVIDENTWLAAYIGGQLSRRDGWSANTYVRWVSTNDLVSGDETGYGASASYYRNFLPRLRGTVAVAIDGVSSNTPSIDDIWSASALAGLRYSF